MSLLEPCGEPQMGIEREFYSWVLWVWWQMGVTVTETRVLDLASWLQSPAQRLAWNLGSSCPQLHAWLGKQISAHCPAVPYRG